MFSPLIAILEETGAGIIQMPCPEFIHLGPSRPLGTDTVEQYDTPQYRDCCRNLARCIAAQAASYEEAGYVIVCVLGVEGSPSCGVSRAPRLVGQDSQLQPGSGVFVEVLEDQFRAAGLRVPFLGIPESEASGSLDTALARLRGMLAER